MNEENIITTIEEKKNNEDKKIDDGNINISITEPDNQVNKENIPYNYTTLVVSGGSTKGLIGLGALQYAQDNFFLNNIKTFIGTSVGSMIVYLIAIGYTPIEIMIYICTHQLIEKIQHFNVMAMINGSGASSFTNIQEQLELMTIEKIGRYITLGDLKEMYGKTFICATYNATKGHIEYLTPDTHPKLPCITAIRMSSNLPFIFDKFNYMGSHYLDGGLGDNFPIHYNDKEGEKILGINILPEEEGGINYEGEMDIIEYVYKLYFIPMLELIRLRCKNASHRCTIVKLKHNDLKFFTFGLNSKIKLEMFSKGFQQAKKFFL